MTLFYEFRIDFWEKLGFRFSHKKLYDGCEKKYGYATYDHIEFTLIIGQNTIASVYNKVTKKEEHHALVEDEAIEWFSRESEKFLHKILEVKRE